MILGIVNLENSGCPKCYAAAHLDVSELRHALCQCLIQCNRMSGTPSIVNPVAVFHYRYGLGSSCKL